MVIIKTPDFSIEYKDIILVDHSPLEHYHDSFELAFFINAQLHIFVKDINYSLKGGDMLFIDEYDIHRMVYNPNSTYARYVINFRKGFILPFLNYLKIETILNDLKTIPFKKASLNLKQTTEMESLFKNLLKLNGKIANEYQPAITSALIKSYLLIILSKLKMFINQNKADVPDTKNLKVQAIVQYIDGHYMSPLSLDKLQEVFNISKFHISHIFKEVTGFTVTEYIQYRRIIEAQKMLKSK
ncbi:MAG TPA: hypothetical protein DDW50_14635, partial [Firmicutes bacterium]|nr:hypothetical protein [Bacillota bacterium]